VLADGVVVGRLFKVNAAPVGIPWMWTLEVEHCGDRRPTYGYDARCCNGRLRQELAAGVKKAPAVPRLSRRPIDSI
jgi:hypothetical protein